MGMSFSFLHSTNKVAHIGITVRPMFMVRIVAREFIVLETRKIMAAAGIVAKIPNSKTTARKPDVSLLKVCLISLLDFPDLQEMLQRLLS